jgi:hypothetical protein
MIAGELSKYPEWDMMYTRGLTASQIARACHAPVSTVAQYLYVQCRANPSVAAAHKAAKPSRLEQPPSAQWRHQFGKTKAYVAETGHFPIMGSDDGGGPLATWLRQQRVHLAAGTLSRHKAEALDRLGDWTVSERDHRNNAEWSRRFQETVNFVKAEGRMPRYRHFETELEHHLGVWLHKQHQRRTEGKLLPRRLSVLNEAIPGWRSHY